MRTGIACGTTSVGVRICFASLCMHSHPRPHPRPRPSPRRTTGPNRGKDPGTPASLTSCITK